MGSAKVRSTVVDETELGGPAARSANEASPQQWVGLGPQPRYRMHVIDTHQPVKTLGNTENSQQVVGVVPRRIGDQPALTRERRQFPPQARPACHERRQVTVRMRRTQEIVSLYTVMADQPKKGGPVAMPVPGAQRSGSLQRHAQTIRYKAGHARIDFGHQTPAGIVKGVIQVDQPYPPLLVVRSRGPSPKATKTMHCLPCLPEPTD